MKFIILLHKVAYNYVTLFDVYECAISPVVLERKLKEAERRLGESDSVLVSEDNCLKHPRDLEPFEFRLNTELGLYKAKSSAGLLAVLKDKNIAFEILNESAEATVSQDKREQVEAVKRWFYNDWQRIEPKLRTSIVEGISVFLSLFDDSPVVKRTFCPAAECYDPVANRDFKFGRPLPSLFLANRKRQVVLTQFPSSYERWAGKGTRRDDEARLRASRLESYPADRGAPRAIFSPSAVPLRRIPSFCHRWRE